MRRGPVFVPTALAAGGQAHSWPDLGTTAVTPSSSANPPQPPSTTALGPPRLLPPPPTSLRPAMIPLSRILDPDKRLDWARHLLDKSPTAAHTDPPAVAALVCLVDLVAWLATHPLPDSASDSHCAALTPGNRTSGTHATSWGAGSSPGRPRPPTAVGTDDADRAATGLCAQRRTAAPEWDTWREYLAEVVRRPCPPPTLPAARSATRQAEPLLSRPCLLLRPHSTLGRQRTTIITTTSRSRQTPRRLSCSRKTPSSTSAQPSHALRSTTTPAPASSPAVQAPSSSSSRSTTPNNPAPTRIPTPTSAPRSTCS